MIFNLQAAAPYTLHDRRVLHGTPTCTPQAQTHALGCCLCFWSIISSLCWCAFSSITTKGVIPSDKKSTSNPGQRNFEHGFFDGFHFSKQWFYLTAQQIMFCAEIEFRTFMDGNITCVLLTVFASIVDGGMGIEYMRGSQRADNTHRVSNPCYLNRSYLSNRFPTLSSS